MVAFCIEVFYDGERYGYYYVEANSFDNAKYKLCDKICDEGIINPWLRAVDERLEYKEINKRKL